jgi:hypothetical protein
MISITDPSEINQAEVTQAAACVEWVNKQQNKILLSYPLFR